MPITLPALKRFHSFIVFLDMALFKVEHAYNFKTNTLPEPQVTSYSSQPSVRNLCQLLTKRSKMRSKMLPMPTEQLDSYVEEKSLLEMAKTHFFPDWNCLQWFLRLLCQSLVPARAILLTDLALVSSCWLDLPGPNQWHHEFWSHYRTECSWDTGKLHDWIRCSSQCGPRVLSWRRRVDGCSSCLRMWFLSLGVQYFSGRFSGSKFFGFDRIFCNGQVCVAMAPRSDLPWIAIQSKRQEGSSSLASQHIFKLKLRKMWNAHAWILEEKALLEISKVGVFCQRNSSISDFPSTFGAIVAKCARRKRSSVSTQCSPVHMESWATQVFKSKATAIFLLGR